jgi:hypothetical protein
MSSADLTGTLVLVSIDWCNMVQGKQQVELTAES